MTRKRYIKLMMSHGASRNEARGYAGHIWIYKTYSRLFYYTYPEARDRSMLKDIVFEKMDEFSGGLLSLLRGSLGATSYFSM